MRPPRSLESITASDLEVGSLEVCKPVVTVSTLNRQLLSMPISLLSLQEASLGHPSCSPHNWNVYSGIQQAGDNRIMYVRIG